MHNCKDIVVVGHIWSNDMKQTVRALLKKAKKIAVQKSSCLYAILYVENQVDISDILYYGAKKLFVMHISRKDLVVTNRLVEHTKEILYRVNPDVVLFDASKLTNDIAPIIAVDFNTGLTAECVDFKISEENGLLEQIRNAYQGNMMASILCPKMRPQMATAKIQENVEYNEMMYPVSEVLTVDIADIAYKRDVNISLSTFLDREENISNNGIYVGIGRGALFEKGVESVLGFAEVLNATVVCSRAVVDAGKMDYSKQIGLTGKVISPKIYIACGISGALQHLTGLKDAKYIIAINKDPDAYIFKICDYGIVGSVDKVISVLMNKLGKE